MKNPFAIVKDFEQAVAEYTGAPYCVAVNSCTNALFLCLVYTKMTQDIYKSTNAIEIPKRTYIGVAQSVLNAGFFVHFREEDWRGVYTLRPFSIIDAARRFTTGMYINLAVTHHYMCVSFHWSKILGIQQGGAILHNNPVFDKWARRARFDGRTEGKEASKDMKPIRGWHMYMSPEIAAEGLVRLSHLPKKNEDLPNSDYPDLSKMDIFKCQ